MHKIVNSIIYFFFYINLACYNLANMNYISAQTKFYSSKYNFGTGPGICSLP